jgi:iron(III) transport system ATP-binding protein
MAMSDRILLLRNGRIEQEGTPQQLYGAPQTLYTAEFMGSNNRFAGTVTHGGARGGAVQLQGAGWQLRANARAPLATGDTAQVVVRLENVRVAGEPGANRLSARLLTSMFLGDRWEYLFESGEQLRFRAFGSQPRATGDTCWLELPPESCWAFAA